LDETPNLDLSQPVVKKSTAHQSMCCATGENVAGLIWQDNARVVTILLAEQDADQADGNK
jgi:hypothetical protein